MDNFLFGLGALFDLLQVELTVLFYSPVMRGFLAGYLVASLMYGFIVAGHQRKELPKNSK